MSITIIDVARAMGVELSNEQAWAVGDSMQRLYRRDTGHEPPKELRPKTSGAGSHCFAIYPESWRGLIEQEIRAHGAQDDAQMRLYGDDE